MNPARPSAPKSFRRALFLNILFPGSGLLYFGHPVSGWLYSIAFASCFVGGISLFLIGYLEYFNLVLSDQLMEGDELENIPELFRPKWLMTLMGMSVLLLFSSTATLIAARQNSSLTKG